MSSSASAAIENDEEETLTAKEALAKQLEVLLDKPTKLAQKLEEILGFFSVEGISKIDSDLGYTLAQMEDGSWGETFAHTVRTNKERENDYTTPLTLIEALGAVSSDFGEFLDFIMDSEEAIEKAWAAMMRAIDADWKPEPQGEGEAGGE